MNANAMKKGLTAVLLAVCLVPLGCATSDDAASSRGATTESPVSAPMRAETRRTIDIYAAVIRRLVTRDHTFGQTEPPFEVIYVLDGAVQGAADPQRTLDEPDRAQRFASEIKDGLTEELEDLPELTFVGRRSAVIEGAGDAAGPGRVMNGGVLLTLGPIVARGSNAEVEASLWLNGLAGQWLTYVVRKREGTWEVTGTTGPVSIS
jgi:hypothetical protein